MADHVEAPFTAGQVASLNAYQAAGVFHPFTCPHHDDLDGHALLLATTTGWRCGVQECTYRQGWAHMFMANWAWRRMGWPRPEPEAPPTPAELLDVLDARVAVLRDRTDDRCHAAFDALSADLAELRAQVG